MTRRRVPATDLRIGVVDESSPTIDRDQIVYSMAMVIMDFEEYERLSVTLPALLARKRAFHYEQDRGPEVRGRMLDELTTASLVVVCAAEVCEPKGQGLTRELLLDRLVLPRAAAYGVNRLIIESRSGAENERDRSFIRSWCRDLRHSMPELGFVDKTNPITWFADLVAGLFADNCRDRETDFDRLARSRRLDAAMWPNQHEKRVGPAPRP